MPVILISSLKEAFQRGKLIDLSNDFRTGTTIRGSLPDQTNFAMSTAAFNKHIQHGASGRMLPRLDSLCTMLRDLPATPKDRSHLELMIKYSGADGQPQSHPVKLEWFAAEHCWIILQ